MELFFLWLWLSLPTIYWTGLFGLIAVVSYLSVWTVLWVGANSPDSMQTWYYNYPRSLSREDKVKLYNEYRASFPVVKCPYKAPLIAVVIGLFCWVMFIPSQKNVAILVGASYAMDMAKSPEGAKVQTLLRSKVNEYLDDEIKAINPEKK